MDIIYKERLLKLADFLETRVPEANFDLSRFAESNNDNSIEEQSSFEKDLLEGKCGAVACAIGWCPIVFPEDFMYINDLWHMPDIVHIGSSYKNFSAAREFFNLHGNEVSFLFDWEGWELKENDPSPTPKEVAERIRYFVNSKLNDPHWSIK